MNQIRNRIERIEETLGHADAENERVRTEMFASQLSDLTDAELDRLEAITLRTIEVGGADGWMIAPADCLHLRDLIAHVDANETAYLAAVMEASR